MDDVRIAEVKGMIVDLFRQRKEKLAGYSLFFFGSRVAGTARPRSDFDVGMIGKGAVPARLFFELRDALDDLETLYKIDLVDFADVSPKFRQEALRHTEKIL